MGTFNDIMDGLFGDQGEAAAEAAGVGAEENRDFLREAIKQQRVDINTFSPSIAADRRAGDQAALDQFGRVGQGQLQAFQGGNVAAQRLLGGGLQQTRNALLGRPVDLGFARQTTRLGVDPSVFQQQLPELQGTPQLNEPLRDVLFRREQEQQRVFNDAFREARSTHNANEQDSTAFATRAAQAFAANQEQQPLFP